jgi:hypothetical protein
VTEKTQLPRWLIIVQQERRELYADLRRNFQPDERVEVILDRRGAERRAEGLPVEADRRRQHRRRPLTAPERDLWDTAGFRLYYRDEDIDVYERPSGKPKKRRTPGKKRVRTTPRLTRGGR